MKKTPLIAAVIFAITTSTAMAAGYGAAGCGFGGSLIKDNKMLPQIGAWFLNSISGNQTFAMTSGTSECGSSGLVLAEKEQNVFVAQNYQDLAKEMAAGEGENLTVLAGLLGCPADRAPRVGELTQASYASIFSSEATTASDMLGAVKTTLLSDPGLASSCQRL